RKPQPDTPARDPLSQHDGTARIEANHVKCVLAHIYSDGDHCLNGGLARHRGAPAPDKPPRTLRAVGGGSAAGPSHSRPFAATEQSVAFGANRTLAGCASANGFISKRPS